MSGLVLTVCALMHMRSIPPNLGNPVISVNCGSFSQSENEASLDARLLTLRVAEAIGQARGRFTRLSRLRDYKP